MSRPLGRDAFRSTTHPWTAEALARHRRACAQSPVDRTAHGDRWAAYSCPCGVEFPPPRHLETYWGYLGRVPERPPLPS